MIKDTSIANFINELKSSSPTPGGGGVSAFNSAQGVALIMMVANLTVENDKYKDWHELCNKTLAECEGLLEVLVNGADKDAEVFGKVIEAYGLPANTDEEKKARSIAIGDASIAAAKAPLEVMEASARALELAAALIGNSNPTVESDLHVAARSLEAGLLGAKYNVDANIGAIAKINPELAEELDAKSKSYIDVAFLPILR